MRTIFVDLRNLNFLKAEIFKWLSEFDELTVIIQNKKTQKSWSYINEQKPQKNGDSKQFMVIPQEQSLISRVKTTLT